MKHLIYFFALCVLTFSIIGNVNAQVPNKISYQGLLTTSSGTPVQDGSYDLQFDIYNLPSGGTLRHTETRNGVSVQRGTFSVILRPTSTIFAESLFVEVTALAGPSISSPVTFTPRSELSSAPYSLAPWSTIGSNISFMNGNVGIGTTGPTYKLQIDGGASATQGLRVGSLAAGGVVASFGANGEFQIDASGVPGGRLIVKESGNVGIGTTTPDANAKLDVNGYAFAKAPVVVYEDARGTGSSFDISWFLSIRVDNNIVQKHANSIDFIFKKAGWYRISCFVFFITPVASSFFVSVFKNGSEYKRFSNFQTLSSSNWGQFNGSVLVQSAVNTQFKIYAGSYPTQSFNVYQYNSTNQLSIEYLGAE